MAVIGVVKETKDGERRVSVLPSEVSALARSGHTVLVQRGAGASAGAEDADYAASGAFTVSAAGAWAADVVVKVKEPLPSEFMFFRPGLRLFCFLHLAADPVLASALAAAGVEAYAFEGVEVAGRRPVLEPMSEVAGRTAAIVGSYMLSSANGGSGVLPGGLSSAPSGRALVVGVGVSGEAAARSLSALGMRVSGADVSFSRAYRLLEEGILDSVVDVRSSRFPAAVSGADLVIGSVLVPSSRSPVVVTREMVSSMREGSAVVDIAIDQGGCLETSRPTSLSDPIFVDEGVNHYCVTNMPGQFPVSASAALSSSLGPYLTELAATVGRPSEGDFYGSLVNLSAAVT